MRPIRSRLARALALAFLLTFSLQVSVALADDPVVADPTAPPADPAPAPTVVPEDPGFGGGGIPGLPENPGGLVPTTPEDPGFGG
ncbi:MAG: hypothetical protein E6J09_01540 [Chloroflexi bacterium]|nr:MAG: hypothetical protein E6J09_01540 [Chloroflexota bacterium]